MINNIILRDSIKHSILPPGAGEKPNVKAIYPVIVI